MGFRVSQVKPFKPSNFQAPEKKKVLPSIFLDTSFILDNVKLSELANNSFE